MNKRAPLTERYARRLKKEIVNYTDIESVTHKAKSNLIQNYLPDDFKFKVSYGSFLRRKRLRGKILLMFYSCLQNCKYGGLQLSLGGISAQSHVDDILQYARKQVLTFLKRQLHDRSYSLSEAYDAFRCAFKDLEYGFPDYCNIISSEYTFAAFIFQRDQNSKNII